MPIARLTIPGCVNGRWGPNCDMDCGHCWNNSACGRFSKQSSASSPRCESGYQGVSCTIGKWQRKHAKMNYVQCERGLSFNIYFILALYLALKAKTTLKQSMRQMKGH